jgi:hypothetical protein
LLRDICNKGIVLEGGKLAYAGDITSSLKHYHDLLAQLRADNAITLEAPATAGAQVYGAIEEIRPGDSDGLFLIKGWMVDTEGALPRGIALEMDGHRYAAHMVEGMRRPDVMQHLGLSTDACGFRAAVSIPGISRLSDLGAELRILGGQSAEHADAPLRIGPAVAVALRMNS